MPNKALQEAMYENMRRLGPPAFDAADLAFAEKLQTSALTEEEILASVKPHDISLKTKVLHDGVLSMPTREEVMMGTTDVGDVSWIVPTVQCHTACFAIGTPFHTWQLVRRLKKEMWEAAEAEDYERAAQLRDTLNEIEVTTQKVTSLIEPVVIVFMALIVGFIVLSIVLPLVQNFNV